MIELHLFLFTDIRNSLWVICFITVPGKRSLTQKKCERNRRLKIIVKPAITFDITTQG